MLIAMVLGGVAFACPSTGMCSSGLYSSGVYNGPKQPDIRTAPGVDMGVSLAGPGSGLNFRFAPTDQWALETDLIAGIWDGAYGTNWSYGGRAGFSVVPGRAELSSRSSVGPRLAGGLWGMVNDSAGAVARQDIFGPYAQAGFEWAPSTRNGRLTVIGGAEWSGQISEQGYLYLNRPRPHFGMRWRMGG